MFYGINGFLQDCGNSMVLAMETAEPYHKPFISSKTYAIFSNVMLYLSIY